MRYSVVLLTFIFASCASNTGTGALTGAILGGGAGGLAGGTKGGLIGGAAGLIAGGLVGVILDTQDRLVMQKNSPRTVDRMDRGDPLTINDVIKLSQSGVSDDTIMQYIGESLSFYTLSQTQIRRLQHSGVSQRVINTMIESGRR